jgi:hypothetical protein
MLILFFGAGIVKLTVGASEQSSHLCVLSEAGVRI